MSTRAWRPVEKNNFRRNPLRHLFQVNEGAAQSLNPHMKNNTFIGQKPSTQPLPSYEASKEKLPHPFWVGHDSTIASYDKAWEIAFRNLRKGKEKAGFVSDFIDSAFSEFLYMWDSSFIVMFGKYGSRAFDFQKTLDNFYGRQHCDGFICRTICETQSGDGWSPFDPCSTGPNILPWAEWRYYCSTGDKERLGRVFDPLSAYHWWLQRNRTWQDGTYWSSGWGCGMDNQPRLQSEYCVSHSHGHMSWIDTCAQSYLSADLLCKMAKELGREEETLWLENERKLLSSIINEKMWNEADGFYYDKYRDGSLGTCKTVGAYWTLLAGLVPEDRKARFIAHLENEKEFNRPNRVPTISADHPLYAPEGDYWRGSVWAPTNYMVLEGLCQNGYLDLAYDIARSCVDNETKVFEETGTIWENYAPEHPAHGNRSKGDFVGWSGLFPISILLEYVFGIHPDAANRSLVWDIHLTDSFGVDNYPLGDATLSLHCEARKDDSEEPNVRIQSDKPVTVSIRWNGKTKQIVCS